MKRYTWKGYVILFFGSFVTLLTFHHLLRHDPVFRAIKGSYILLIISFFTAFFGAYLINRRSYQRYDHIQRAQILKTPRPPIIDYSLITPRLNYEAILLQALSFIHHCPNKSAQELFDDNYDEISDVYADMTEPMWDNYIKELKMCLRSYL